MVSTTRSIKIQQFFNDAKHIMQKNYCVNIPRDVVFELPYWNAHGGIFYFPLRILLESDIC